MTRVPVARTWLSSASHAALLGLVVLAAGGAVAGVARAAPASAERATDTSPAPTSMEPASRPDPLAMESLLDQPGKEIDLTAVDPVDWAPDHASKTLPAEMAPAKAPSPAAAATPAAAAIASTGEAARTDLETKTLETKGSEPKSSASKSSASKSSASKSSASKDSELESSEPKSPETQKAGKSDADMDPEPDAVVVPSTPSPSNDPLDRPRPAAAGTPGQAPASKPAAATDPAKPGPVAPDGKTDAAKTDPKATPGAPGAAAPSTPVAVEPLPPLNAAIKAALDKEGAVPIKGPGASEKRKERDAVAFFYAAHGFAPAWSEKGKSIAAVAPVLARLGKAGDDALSVPNVPTSLKTDGSPEEVAASDLALTQAVVAYARQATGSRIDPRSISVLIGAKPQLADPAEVLDGLISAGSGAGDKLAAQNPSEPRYAALREKLSEIRGERERPAAATTDTPVPDGPILRVGMHDERVPLLRRRFNIEAKGDGEDADLLYDKEVAAAVTAFQREHDLVPSGQVGARTTAVLNGGVSAEPREKSSPKLEAAIVANMEMWRWMPRDMGRERIEVNVPDYEVTVFHDDEPVGKNRVVVGKTESPTPIFSNTMKYLIVNPVWNVPQSIIKNELGGEARGFKARYVNGRLYLQQPSGPKNALGRIKFMFPNDFSVYLHDTPAKHLFSASKRAFSHGCVRVDKPFEFAESVLNDAVPEGGKIQWNQKRLEKMLGTTERYVNLPTPLPIHIEYFTASIDGAAGKVNLRPDVYGYAGAVAEALGYGKSSVPVAHLEQKNHLAEAKQRKRRLARRSSDDDGYDPRPQVEAAPAQGSRGFFFPW